MSESEATAAEAVEEQAAEETPAAAARGLPGGRRDRGAGGRGPPDPAADVDVENDPDITAAEEELAEEAIPVPVGPAAGRQAKVYLCERGHRTVAMWSDAHHLPGTPDRAAPSAAASSTRSASCPSRSRRR